MKKDKSFDHNLERDPRFLKRIERARASLQAGKGVKLKEIAGDIGTTRRRKRKVH